MTGAHNTIADSVADFNVGFTAAIGPELAQVFATEQADLNAAGLPEGVVAVGDALADATLVRSDGSSVQLHEELAGAPAVLVFYRGAWCPYCNLTLKHYNEALAPTLAERAVRLIAISPQTPAGTEAAILKDDLKFTVLSDPGNTLAGKLGIVTEPSIEARDAHTKLGFAVADSNADNTPGIPFPTVLVVSASGTIAFVDVQVDYTARTEVPEIVEAVVKL